MRSVETAVGGDEARAKARESSADVEGVQLTAKVHEAAFAPDQCAAHGAGERLRRSATSRLRIAIRPGKPANA